MKFPILTCKNNIRSGIPHIAPAEYGVFRVLNVKSGHLGRRKTGNVGKCIRNSEKRPGVTGRKIEYVWVQKSSISKAHEI